jgi:O-antigen/teichoic acid export membrane protein
MRALSLATVFAALSGFVVLFVAAWALGEVRYDQFQAYWGLFFALAGLLDGLTHETTRASSSARERGAAVTETSAAPRSARPWRLALIVGGVVLLVVAASAWAWMPLLVSEGSGATALMAIGLFSYAFQAVLSGLLSGLKLWPQYAWLMAIDSGIRLVLSVAAWAAGWGLTGFYLVTVIGSVTWLGILTFSGRARESARAPLDVSMPVYARRVGSAMLASGASAALITGFPVLLQATSHGSATLTGVSVSALMMAITLTRAPILVPLQRFQSALIVRFVGARDSVVASLGRPLALVLGLGLVGAAAAWLIGPWFMVAFLPEGFGVSGWILAVLTFASACTGSLMITGAAVLALERHAFYVAGWVTATLVAFGVLLTPLPLEIGVSAALIVGPLAGGLVHVAALRRVGRQPVEEYDASENVT